MRWSGEWTANAGQGSGIGDQGSGIGIRACPSPIAPPNDRRSSIWPISRTIQPVYACCATRTRLAYSRESRAQMATPAAAEADEVLRHRRPGRHHPPGPHRRADGAPALNRRAGREPVVYAHPRSSRCWNARSACRSSRSSCCAWRWWWPASPAGRRTAASHGLQAIREAHEADRGAAARGHGQKRHLARRDGADHPVDYLVRAVGFPESHAASFALLAYASAHSRCITRRRSIRRCSTTSRWVSTIRPRW